MRLTSSNLYRLNRACNRKRFIHHSNFKRCTLTWHRSDPHACPHQQLKALSIIFHSYPEQTSEFCSRMFRVNGRLRDPSTTWIIQQEAGEYTSKKEVLTAATTGSRTIRPVSGQMQKLWNWVSSSSGRTEQSWALIFNSLSNLDCSVVCLLCCFQTELHCALFLSPLGTFDELIPYKEAVDSGCRALGQE